MLNDTSIPAYMNGYDGEADLVPTDFDALFSEKARPGAVVSETSE